MNSLFGMIIISITLVLVTFLLWLSAAVNGAGLLTLDVAVTAVFVLATLLALARVLALVSLLVRERKALGLTISESADLLNGYLGGDKPDEVTFALLRPKAVEAG